MNGVSSETITFVTIFCAALVTYGLRFGGLMLSEKLPKNGGFKAFMDALPGTILLSLVAPGIALAGFWGIIGAASTAVCTWKTGNVFVSMVLGMGIVAVSRYFML